MNPRLPFGRAPAVLLGAALALSAGATVRAADVEQSVVKVFATMREPDPYRPWTKAAPVDITASGVVIDGRRILTNAHAVLYATDIQIQGRGEGDKHSATVAFVAPGIDLAVLKLDDESFFADHPPLELAADIPAVKDPVLVYGFPTGGDNLSITKGIISRIEFTGYNFPVSGLRIQIDAAINPGNSGGPAVLGDRMIGLAFSRLGGEAENIGYIIPAEEIELFLRDVASGGYHGKPAMFDELQTLENPALRAFLKLDRSVDGIVVRQPFGDGPGYPLRAWDVITRIGDAPVDDQGMVQVRGDLRLNFQYLVQKVARDGKVPLTVVRDGKTIQVLLPVSPDRPVLIPSLNGAYPSYFIYGPLVFSAATSDFVNNLSRNFRLANLLADFGNPLITRRGEKPAFPGEQLVVISSRAFPDKLAEGYSDPWTWVVRSVNDHRVRNLADLVATLRDCRTTFVTFAFWGRGGETLVFRRDQVLASTDDILADNGVRSQGSPDMMAIWNGRPNP